MSTQREYTMEMFFKDCPGLRRAPSHIVLKYYNQNKERRTAEINAEPVEEVFYPAPGIYAKPLLEVFSVDLQHNDNDVNCHSNREFAIYGQISITNGQDETFLIYNCAREEALQKSKSSSSGSSSSYICSLPLCGPNEPIVPVLDLIMNVELKDRAHDDVVIAKGCFKLNMEYSEEGRTIKCMANDYDTKCIVAVCYTIFPLAFAYRVEKLQFVDEHNCGDEIPVTGSIVALTDKRSYIKDVNSCMLFDNNRTVLKHDMPIDLSRSLVVVPAYGSLFLELKLYDARSGNTLVDDTIEIPHNYGPTTKKIALRGYDAFVRVVVNLACKSWDPFKGSQLARNQNNKLPICEIPSWAHRNTGNLDLEPMPLIEVFSVRIGSIQYKSFDINGFIEVLSPRDKYFIFEKSKDNPMTCSLPCKLRIAGPRGKAYRWSCFGMRLKLNHRDTNIGIGSYGYDDLEGEFRMNRLLCSVYESDIGYVALHYAMFVEAAQAKVCVLFDADAGSSVASPSHFLVSGRILASYSCFSYPTNYEKDYYRSVLFDKDYNEPSSCSSELTLLKDVLVVPLFSSVIVEVDLNVFGEAFVDTVEFEIGDYSGRVIKGQNCCITITIPEWIDYSN